MQNFYIGVEFSDNICKIVQLRINKGIVSLNKTIFVTLRKPDEDEKTISSQTKAQRIKDALKNNRITADNVVLSIPKNFVTVRSTRLPSTNDEEIQQMARFEAERHIPFNVERHVIGHSVMQKDNIDGSLTLIAAVDSTLIQPYIEILTLAGVEISSITVSSVSLFNTLKYVNRNEIAETPLAVINIGLSTTDITLVNKGLIIFTRSVSQGIEQLLNAISVKSTELKTIVSESAKIDVLEPHTSFEDEAKVNQVHEWLGKLINEIRRTYEFARREFECPAIETLYVTGDGIYLQNIFHYLEVNLGMPIKSLNPFASITPPQEFAEIINKIGNGYAIALGGILPFIEAGLVKINLLPKEYSKKVSKEHQKKSLILTGILSFVAIIFAIVWMQQVRTAKSELISYYNKQINVVKPTIDEIKDKTFKLKIIEDYVKDKNSALAILNEISKHSELLPNSVSITNFDYRKDDRVEIVGYALSYLLANDFETMLKETGFFDRVQVTSRNPVDLPSRTQVIKFDVMCVLKKNSISKAKSKL